MNLGILTHVYNEEMLLPHWIEHHLPLVEQMVIIDHHSTDNTVEVIRSLAPEATIVTSRLHEFDASGTDAEVMDVEASHLSTKWKCCLNVTEFLWCKDLPSILEVQGSEYEAIGLRAYMMVDSELNLPLDEPLWKNRTNGYLDNETSLASRRWRYVHRMEHGGYGLGRHNTAHKATRNVDWNILFAEFSPWPQAVERKMQVQTKIPAHDRAAGAGVQHQQSLQTLDNFYRSELSKSSNLLLDKNFKANYDNYINQRGLA